MKKGKVFILNKPFEGSYTNVDGNVAHEIINYFKADNNKIYIYNNPWGHCPNNVGTNDDREYEAEYMFLAKKAKMSKQSDENKWSEFEITHLIKIKKCLHHESTHEDEAKLKKAQEEIKKVINDEKINYSGLPIYQIYGDKDASLYVTFEAEKIYIAKDIIKVRTPNYRFQRNKGYVFSDIHKDAFKVLNGYTDLKYWNDITSNMKCINVNNFKPNRNKTFLDLILKVDSEECYTNILYAILSWNNTMNLFAEKFSKTKNVDSNEFNVYRELKIPQSGKLNGGRTDICAYNNTQRIVIENKVFSGLNGIDVTNRSTQLTIYYNWAKEKGKLEPLCFISCPDFRRKEIELEIEPEMKDICEFVQYSKIGNFIEKLNDDGHFKGFQYEAYIKDIIIAFERFGYQNKTELFEQLFLQSIQEVKSKIV